MLFPQNALASGPQACFLAKKGIAKVKVAKQPEIRIPQSIKKHLTDKRKLI
jgi:hypothetical protein